VRPRGKDGLKPEVWYDRPEVHEEPVAWGGHVSVGLRPFLGACGARPSAGWIIRARVALRGKTRG